MRAVGKVIDVAIPALLSLTAMWLVLRAFWPALEDDAGLDVLMLGPFVFGLGFCVGFFVFFSAATPWSGAVLMGVATAVIVAGYLLFTVAPFVLGLGLCLGFFVFYNPGLRPPPSPVRFSWV